MYIPHPINTDDIVLSDELAGVCEQIAANAHEVWAFHRMEEGWTYGEIKDSTAKTTPCMVPYEDLPESEKEYDRNAVTETLKVLRKLGYTVKKADE